jgi:HAD superfamily hydrolase (TIGR01509 family)
MPPAAILDIDGTLVDTNYHHAVAWYRAFRQQSIALPIWRIHRHMGMGGDNLVQSLTSEAFDEEYGDEVRAAEKVLYMELIEECAPMQGARELIEELKRRGHHVVLASSAKAAEVDYYLDLLDARELADDWTTSADVEKTKPAPDLLLVALEKIGEPKDAPSVVVGDSVYDVLAADNAGMQVIVLRCGGFGDDELRAAGATSIYDTPAELVADLDRTPFGV